MQYVLVFSDPMHLILWSGHISSLFDGSAPRISVIVHPKEMSPAVKIPLRATRMSMTLSLPSCLLLCTRSNARNRIHPPDFTRWATRTLMRLSNMTQRLTWWALKYSRSCPSHIRYLHASSGHVDMCKVRFCDQHSRVLTPQSFKIDCWTNLFVHRYTRGCQICLTMPSS